jgi:hypothetical protein
MERSDFICRTTPDAHLALFIGRGFLGQSLFDATAEI